MVQRAIGVLCTDMGYRILPPKQDSGWFCNTLLLLFKIDHGIRIYIRLANRLIRTGLVTMMSFWVSSVLECSLYRWRLFVYFTFPSI